MTLKLMLAEDNPEIATTLIDFARTKGYEVHWAGDGYKAVEIGQSEKPDVILMDVNMPGLDGRDALVQLKNSGAIDSSIVIFLTARGDQSDRLVGLELGAHEYEVKPVHFEHLFLKIARLLEKQRAESC